MKFNRKFGNQNTMATATWDQLLFLLLLRAALHFTRKTRRIFLHPGIGATPPPPSVSSPRQPLCQLVATVGASGRCMLQHLPLRDPRETLREPREGSGSSIATRKAQETFWLVPAQPELELPIGSAGPVRAQPGLQLPTSSRLPWSLR